MVHHDNIQNFIEFFSDQLVVVKSLNSDPSIYASSSNPPTGVAIHKKILYSAILDCLAGIRYHGESLQNRERFIRFLSEHTGWHDGYLVSAPVLRARLVSTSPLRDHLDIRLASRSTQAPNAVAITVFDEPEVTLRPLATGDELGHLKKCQHFDLFYEYRNFIVHEFRQPGNAMETFADDGVEPLYHGYIGDPCWYLLYPVAFFARRASAAVDSLEQWLMAEDLDPYARVPASTNWLRPRKPS